MVQPLFLPNVTPNSSAYWRVRRLCCLIISQPKQQVLRQHQITMLANAPNSRNNNGGTLVVAGLLAAATTSAAIILRRQRRMKRQEDDAWEDSLPYRVIQGTSTSPASEPLNIPPPSLSVSTTSSPSITSSKPLLTPDERRQALAHVKSRLASLRAQREKDHHQQHSTSPQFSPVTAPLPHVEIPLSPPLTTKQDEENEKTTTELIVFPTCCQSTSKKTTTKIPKMEPR